METSSIEYRIASLIVEQLKVKLPNADPAALHPNLDLFDELGIDSIDMAAIALRVQDYFSIVFREDDYEGFRSIDAIAKFVRNRMPATERAFEERERADAIR